MRNWNDSRTWNEAVLAVPPYSGQFLHSWEWGEFLKARGREIVRLGDEDALMMLVREKLPFGREYLYSPKGPVMRDRAVWNEILETVRERTNKKTIFFRCEPNKFQVSSFKFQSAKAMQPERTILVDLSKGEEELLGAMHEKTRYNIRLAERRGVQCEMKGADAAETFWKLLQETARRDRFSTHERPHYEKLLEAMDGDPSDRTRASARIMVATFEGRPIAANLIVFFGEVATYLHGASGGARRNVMAPFLLHWWACRLAKRLGYGLYDLWGIDEKRWPGLTRFKHGFGGAEVTSPGTWELPLNRFWYTLYSLAKRMRP